MGRSWVWADRMAGVDMDEKIVWEVRKSATPEVWGKLILSLGLYMLWLRADKCTVTNRKVVHRHGLLNVAEEAIPLERIQDVNSKIGPLTGKVAVSSAGVVVGMSIVVGPLWRGQAQKLMQVVQEQMQGRR